VEDPPSELAAVFWRASLVDAILERVSGSPVAKELARRFRGFDAALGLQAAPQGFNPLDLALVRVSVTVEAFLINLVGLLLAKLATRAVRLAARQEARLPVHLGYGTTLLACHLPDGQTVGEDLVSFRETGISTLRVAGGVRRSGLEHAIPIRTDEPVGPRRPEDLARGRLGGRLDAALGLQAAPQGCNPLDLAVFRGTAPGETIFIDLDGLLAATGPTGLARLETRPPGRTGFGTALHA